MPKSGNMQGKIKTGENHVLWSQGVDICFCSIYKRSGKNSVNKGHTNLVDKFGLPRFAP